MSMKKSNDTIRNRTRDLPACSAVPQQTTLPHAPEWYGPKLNLLHPQCQDVIKGEKIYKIYSIIPLKSSCDTSTLSVICSSEKNVF